MAGGSSSSMLLSSLRQTRFHLLGAGLGSVLLLGSGVKIWNDQQVAINVDKSPLITLAELSKHNTQGDIWVSLHGHVYDVSEFIESHPGGIDKLMRFAGKDGTRGFRLQHPEAYLERFLDPEWYKGELIREKVDNKSKKQNKGTTKNKEKLASGAVKASSDSEEEYYKALIRENLPKRKKKTQKLNEEEKLVTYSDEKKPSLNQIFNLNDFETVAKHLLPPLVYSFIQSGTDNEYTILENRNAFGRIFFKPRCLIDVQSCSSKLNVLGFYSEIPFVVGSLQGESALICDKVDDSMVVETVCKNGLLSIVSSNSTVSLEDTLMKNQSVLYQLTIDSADELKTASARINELSEKYPNIKAFFLSVDSPVVGNIEHYKKLEAMGHQSSNKPSPQLNTREFSLNWDNLAKINKETPKVPLIVKGIQRPEDVIRCQQLGFRGAVISNHDGKTLDQTLSPIEILYDVHKTGRKAIDFELFVEGGFKRGSDVVKAVCLGGIPVISKPILFSELYGREGVQKAIDILKSEVIRDMKFLGVLKVEELNSRYLDCESLKFRVNKIDSDYLYGANYTPLPPPSFKNQHKLTLV